MSCVKFVAVGWLECEIKQVEIFNKLTLEKWFMIHVSDPNVYFTVCCNFLLNRIWMWPSCTVSYLWHLLAWLRNIWLPNSLPNTSFKVKWYLMVVRKIYGKLGDPCRSYGVWYWRYPCMVGRVLIKRSTFGVRYFRSDFAFVNRANTYVGSAVYRSGHYQL